MNKKGDSQKSQRIQVFARCRPLNSIERKQASPTVVEVIPEKKEIVLKERNTTREFLFDKVFPPDSKQITVYKSVVEPLIKEVLNGFNCTVFAYGQTGTGKTYTMEGERSDSQCSWEDDPGAGIIPRSLHQLFEELNKEENVEFSVRVSFLELYNEELFDLLSSSEFTRLRLYEDTNRKGSVIIQGLEEVIVNNKNEVYTILEKGTSRRQTAATLLNATSSRSHTVFSVTVHIKENTIDGEELLKTGKLNLVDLAGSENVGRSGAIEKRAREAGNINQSLLTLGRVITALIEKQPHVPYRESKLTRLLQDSLGGHTKTSIIATVSPAQCNFDETVSTLDYATKAKSITIKPEANKKMTKRALIREYTEEIEHLKKDLVALRSKDGFYVDAENYTNLINSLKEKNELEKDLFEKIDALTEEKSKIEEMFATTKYELSKTCEKLDDTTQKYQETANELSNKNVALVYTQQVLSKTILERDEKQYINNFLKNTEKKLTNQAQALLQVADETTSDVEKLHEKIDRKVLVESTNEQLCQDFRKMYQQQFAKLDDLVSSSKDEQIQDLQRIVKDQDDLFLGLEKYMEMSTVFSDALIQEQAKFNELVSDLNNKTTSERELINNMLSERKTKKDQFIAENQAFLMEKLPKLIANQNDCQSKLKTWFHNKKKNLDEKIGNYNRTIVEQSEKKEELVKSIRCSMKSFINHNDKLLNELKEQVKSLSDLKKFDEFVACYRSNIISEANKAEGTFSELTNNAVRLQTVEESLSKMDLEISGAKSNQLNLAEVDQIINLDEFSAMHESILQSRTCMSSDVSSFMEHSQKMKEEDYEECKKSLETLDSSALKALESNEKSINALKLALSDKVDKNDKCMAEQNASLGGIVKRVLNCADESINKLASTTEKLKKEILRRDLEFEKFVTEDLVKDVPTGETPQRKTFVYPRILAKTSPDNNILRRYRHTLATDLQLAVSTPLDNSFNESDEFKLSPSEEGGKLQSDYTSCMTEDCDYAGCESDSNSSTMSDVSESYRNKENCKSGKKSKLPKRNKFLVPKAPPVRKPLFSNNSDVSLN